LLAPALPVDVDPPVVVPPELAPVEVVPEDIALEVPLPDDIPPPAEEAPLKPAEVATREVMSQPAHPRPMTRQKRERFITCFFEWEARIRHGSTSVVIAL
jgi:hypothetical protein